MKKIISFVLVFMMVAAFFIMPASAADFNTEVKIEYTKTAPKIDGVVRTGEYGLKKIHSSYDADKIDQFITQHDTDKDIDSDFYMTCDKEYLYMAWVVHTDIHVALDPNKDYDDGKDGFTENDLHWMWNYCCVQFILTPGAPKSGTTKYQVEAYSGNFLEVGLTIMEGNSRKTAWIKPDDGQGLTPNDWDFMGNRNESANTTTYEIRLPWEKTGITKVGNDTQFGLTYAIGDQEEYETKSNMLEWQDGILGSKDADKAGVITLTKFPDDKVIDVSIEDGLDPMNPKLIPEDASTFTIDGINQIVLTEKAYIITKTDNVEPYNLKYTLNIVARPVAEAEKENTYSVVSTELATGTTPTFDLEKGDIILAFHTNGETGAGYARKQLASKLAVGDELVLLGIDLKNAKLIYSDSLVYTLKDLDTETSESETSESSDTSDESEPADSEPSDDDSKPATSETASDDNSKVSEEEDGNNLWLYVGIGAGVIVIAAGLYFFVFKKKKA